MNVVLWLNPLQTNHINTETEGAMESVHINSVSALSGLNLEKNVRAFFGEVSVLSWYP